MAASDFPRDSLAIKRCIARGAKKFSLGFDVAAKVGVIMVTSRWIAPAWQVEFLECSWRAYAQDQFSRPGR
ncbi:hypothetical protein C7271_17505 [filamentous cyanobacterium CCP5]|nr:hypothetical protein C7271_17505 [filamentous cyanobacterium CCP5]